MPTTPPFERHAEFVWRPSAELIAESRLNELIQRDIEESLALQQRADKGEAPE